MALHPSATITLTSQRRKREVRGLIMTFAVITLLVAACLSILLVTDSSVSPGAVLFTIATVVVLSVGVSIPLFKLTRGPAQTLTLTNEALVISESRALHTIALSELTAINHLEVSPKARNLEAQHALVLWNAEGNELARIRVNAFEPSELIGLLEALKSVHPLVEIDNHLWHMLTHFEENLAVTTNTESDS